MSYSLKASLATVTKSDGESSPEGSGYTVTAKVTLPATYASSPPLGGVVLRLRAPKGHAGKMSSVTVGGKPWTSFDAKLETVSFSAKQLSAELIKDLSNIKVVF